MVRFNTFVAFVGLLVVVSAELPVVSLKSDIILTGDAHNYYNCPTPAEAETVVLDQVISVDPRWFAVQSRTIQYSDTGATAQKINCIRIDDLDANGQGGYPFVISGGVGNYDATITIVSQRGRGLRFRVQIFTAKGK